MSEDPHAAHRPPVDQDPSTLGPPPPGTFSMGHLYPVGDLLAVIDDRAEAERAVRALKEAGVCPRAMSTWWTARGSPK
jgi:hypothetical protein